MPIIFNFLAHKNCPPVLGRAALDDIELID